MDKLTEAASGAINLVGVAGVCRIDQDLSFLLFAPALRGPFHPPVSLYLGAIRIRISNP